MSLPARIKQFLAEVHSPGNIATTRDKLEVAVALLREVEDREVREVLDEGIEITFDRDTPVGRDWAPPLFGAIRHTYPGEVVVTTEEKASRVAMRDLQPIWVDLPPLKPGDRVRYIGTAFFTDKSDTEKTGTVVRSETDFAHVRLDDPSKTDSAIIRRCDLLRLDDAALDMSKKPENVDTSGAHVDGADTGQVWGEGNV